MQSLAVTVYAIENLLNGKRYIGSSFRVRKRWNEHRRDLRSGKHHSRALQRAWNKYGEQSFSFQPILICAPGDRVLYEQLAIDGLRPEYNSADNVAKPMLGQKHSEQTRLRMSLVNAGRPKGEAHKQNIRAAMMGKKNAFGYKQSAEARANLSAALKGKPKSVEHRKNLAATRIGKRHSAETKEKIGSYSRGRPWTAERRAAQPHTYKRRQEVVS